MELGHTNKVAIVTGGGWGMGKATVLGLADEGVKVVIADLDEGRGNATTKEVKDKGGEALFVKVDVVNWEMVKQTVADTIGRFGQIDILVNNAGAWQTEFFIKQKREDWAFQVDICGGQEVLVSNNSASESISQARLSCTHDRGGPFLGYYNKVT